MFSRVQDQASIWYSQKWEDVQQERTLLMDLCFWGCPLLECKVKTTIHETYGCLIFFSNPPHDWSTLDTLILLR